MVNEEYNPTYQQDGTNYPDGNIYYPANGQQVLGVNNYVSPTSSFIQVLGSDNIIGNGCQFVSIANSSGCVIQGGLTNVSIVNSSGVTVTESNIQYIAGKRIPADSVYISIKRTLTAAEVKTSFSSPIDLVAAPGAGKAIEYLSCFARLNYNSIAFDAGVMSLRYPSSVNALAVSGDGSWPSGFTANSIYRLGAYDYILTSSMGDMIENEALRFGFYAADATTGDSTMDVYLTYRIVTL